MERCFRLTDSSCTCARPGALGPITCAATWIRTRCPWRRTLSTNGLASLKYLRYTSPSRTDFSRQKTPWPKCRRWLVVGCPATRCNASLSFTCTQTVQRPTSWSSTSCGETYTFKSWISATSQGRRRSSTRATGRCTRRAKLSRLTPTSTTRLRAF